jgi:hypothetical protein
MLPKYISAKTKAACLFILFPYPAFPRSLTITMEEGASSIVNYRLRKGAFRRLNRLRCLRSRKR